MISILFDFSLFILLVFLFFREVRLDRKRFLEEHRLANEHVLKEVEKFLYEQHRCGDQNVVTDIEKGL